MRRTPDTVIGPETQDDCRPDPELGPVMAAWGRQQAMLGSETTRAFAELDVTLAQFRALNHLLRDGRLTGRDLARRLSVTPGTVVPLCDRLEEMGYLRRVPDQVDRRLTWLELTPKGMERFSRLRAAAGARMHAAFAQLRPADRRTLARLMNQVADLLEEQARQAHSEGQGQEPEGLRQLSGIRDRLHRRPGQATS